MTNSTTTKKRWRCRELGPYIHSWQRRQWHPTPVLLPGKSHGRRSLVGCSPWGFEESDMTERLHFHFSLFCIGEGNGNPLQCSCLENPRDGVARSQTRLKWLSSSSIHSWLEYKMVQPLWKTVWQFLLKLICLWYDPAHIILLGIYLKEMKTYVCTNTCMQMFIVALFTIA